MAKKLEAARDTIDAARICEQLTRGFYGSDASMLDEPAASQRKQQKKEESERQHKPDRPAYDGTLASRRNTQWAWKVLPLARCAR